MKELKQNMIQEINSYIERTGDKDLEDFQSQYIINYMNENKIDLIWYPVEFENDKVINISIEQI